MHKKRRKGAGCSSVVFLCILVGIAVYFTLGEGRQMVLQMQYPMNYRECVEKYAAQNELDPYLVYAVIKVESRFHADAVSHAGARGLMQLMEETARDSAKKLNVTVQLPEDLLDPDKNVMLGTYYLKSLLKSYGNLELALAAYNGGTGNVQKWLKDKDLSDGKGGLTQIPFEETEKYVRKVLNAYEQYQNLYGAD